MIDIQSTLATHGLEVVDRDKDGLLRVRYTEDNPNRGFFRQFDTMADVQAWLSAYGRTGTWVPEWDLIDD